MSQANDGDSERWYQKEDLEDGSKIRGWRKTERLELVNGLRAEDAPKYQTLVCIADSKSG